MTDQGATTRQPEEHFDELRSIAATDIAHRHGPKLPYIDYQVRRAMQGDSVAAERPETGLLQSPPVAVAIACALAATARGQRPRSVFIRRGRGRFDDGSPQARFVLRPGSGRLTLTWTVDDDGTAHPKPAGAESNTPPQPFVHRLRYRFPSMRFDIQIAHLTDSDQSPCARGQRHLPQRRGGPCNLQNRLRPTRQASLRAGASVALTSTKHQQVSTPSTSSLTDNQEALLSLRLSPDGKVLYHCHHALSGRWLRAASGPHQLRRSPCDAAPAGPTTKRCTRARSA